ncbi:UNVERIFIED_ORG: hypothetical protein ABIC54_002376 [Burkholderia sp. 1263]
MGYYTADALPVYDFSQGISPFAIAGLRRSRRHRANRLMAMAGERAITDNTSGFLPEQSRVDDWLTTNGARWCVFCLTIDRLLCMCTGLSSRRAKGATGPSGAAIVTELGRARELR